MAICVICNYTSKILSKHLLSEHGLSDEEYYLSYVSKTGEVPICSHVNCTQKLNFVKLSKPYGKFCSVSCKSSHTMTKLNNTKDFQAKAQAGFKTKLLNDPEFKKEQRNRAIKQLVAINNSEELSQKSYDARFGDINKVREREQKRLLTLDFNASRTTRYIYFIETDDFYKIGTAVNLTKRLNDISRELNKPVSILFSKEVVNTVAIEIEKLLVIELTNNDCIVPNLQYFGKNETFIKDEVLKTQVLEYLQTSTTIETT